MSFADNLRKANIDEGIIQQIMSVDYPGDEGNPKQDAANFYSAAMTRCEELLDFDTISAVMFTKSCCKGGYRLNNAKQLAAEHGDKPLAEKLALLGELKYMGKPFLNKDGDIQSDAVGTHEAGSMTCPCWYFAGCTPVNGPMPLTYCLCCGSHFKVHYQKALGVKLRIKRVVSSIINSDGKHPCVFVYQIIR